MPLDCLWTIEVKPNWQVRTILQYNSFLVLLVLLFLCFRSQFHFSFRLRSRPIFIQRPHIQSNQTVTTFIFFLFCFLCPSSFKNMSGSLCFIFQCIFFRIYFCTCEFIFRSVFHFQFHRSCYRWKSSNWRRKTIARVILLTLSEMIQMFRIRK